MRETDDMCKREREKVGLSQTERGRGCEKTCVCVRDVCKIKREKERGRKSVMV